MPLRDHFHPPASKQASWEGFHAVWPTTLLMHLKRLLPKGYTAEPRARLGANFEVEVEADWPDQYEYAVLVFDEELGRKMVAAVEFVSPGNKDRPESRHAFVTKCAAFLQQGVAVALVDLVTVRHFNLYAELLECIGQSAGSAATDSEATYAAAVRFRPGPPRSLLQTWPYRLEIGQRLPTLPLWLGPDLAVPLDLEPSYEDACQLLNIG